MSAFVGSYLTSYLPSVETCKRIGAGVTGLALLSPLYHGAQAAALAAANSGLSCLPLAGFSKNLIHLVSVSKPLFVSSPAAQSCLAQTLQTADLTALELASAFVALSLLKRFRKHIQHSRPLPSLPLDERPPALPSGNYTELALKARRAAILEKVANVVTGLYLIRPAYQAFTSGMQIAAETATSCRPIPAYAWELVRSIRLWNTLLEVSPLASSCMSKVVANAEVVTLATCTAAVALYLLYRSCQSSVVAPTQHVAEEETQEEETPGFTPLSPRASASVLNQRHFRDTLVRPSVEGQKRFAYLRDSLARPLARLWLNKPLLKPAAEEGTGNVAPS